MSSKGGGKLVGNAALMRRVDIIESMLPAKPNKLNGHGKLVGYNSAPYRNIEELIGICRNILAPSSDVEELHNTISTLKRELRCMRQKHSQLKVSNTRLRTKVCEETA